MNTVAEKNSVADLLTPREFHEAGKRKIGLNRIYGLCATGGIKTVRIGRKFLIPKSELAAFLERETK